MKTKAPGGSPVQGTQREGLDVQRATGPGATRDSAPRGEFSAVANLAAARPPSVESPDLAAIRRAATSVARELDAGQLEAGRPAIDRLIEHAMRDEAGASEDAGTPTMLRGEALEDAIVDARFLLGDDPTFQRAALAMISAERTPN